jgi:hypothetical protein
MSISTAAAPDRAAKQRQCVCRRHDLHPPTASYTRSAFRPSREGQAAGYAPFPRSILPQEKTMGKYVLGWFLGVPLIVLVAIYFIAH